jgi:hypothetical protein
MRESMKSVNKIIKTKKNRNSSEIPTKKRKPNSQKSVTKCQKKLQKMGKNKIAKFPKEMIKDLFFEDNRLNNNFQKLHNFSSNKLPPRRKTQKFKGSMHIPQKKKFTEYPNKFEEQKKRRQKYIERKKQIYEKYRIKTKNSVYSKSQVSNSNSYSVCSKNSFNEFQRTPKNLSKTKPQKKRTQSMMRSKKKSKKKLMRTTINSQLKKNNQTKSQNLKNKKVNEYQIWKQNQQENYENQELMKTMTGSRNPLISQFSKMDCTKSISVMSNGFSDVVVSKVDNRPKNNKWEKSNMENSFREFKNIEESLQESMKMLREREKERKLNEPEVNYKSYEEKHEQERNNDEHNCYDEFDHKNNFINAQKENKNCSKNKKNNDKISKNERTPSSKYYFSMNNESDKKLQSPMTPDFNMHKIPPKNLYYQYMLNQRQISPKQYSHYPLYQTQDYLPQNQFTSLYQDNSNPNNEFFHENNKVYDEKYALNNENKIKHYESAKKNKTYQHKNPDLKRETTQNSKKPTNLGHAIFKYVSSEEAIEFRKIDGKLYLVDYERGVMRPLKLSQKQEKENSVKNVKENKQQCLKMVNKSEHPQELEMNTNEKFENSYKKVIENWLNRKQK